MSVLWSLLAPREESQFRSQDWSFALHVAQGASQEL